ncbi:MAG: hypothetical protein ABIP63_02180 [Thermoanaerobaculia bacterium]
MKLLTPRMHGYLDFVVVVAFALAPTLFHFSATPTRVSYALSVVHLLLTLFTRFPMGIVKLVPFPIHGAIEFIVSFTLVALPFVLGFAGEQAACNFFIGFGVVVFLVWLVTDYKAADTAAA